MKNSIRLLVIFTALSYALVSAQVDENQVIEFEAGTPATAADVNQNFQALISAINKNAEEIAKLNNSPSLTTQDLEGCVFSATLLGAGHGVQDTQGSSIQNVVAGAKYTLTLQAGGTLAYSESEFSEQVSSFANGGAVAQDLDTEAVSAAGTWSLAGQVLTTTVDGNTDTYLISLDGNAIVGIATEVEPLDTGGASATVPTRNVFIRFGVRTFKPAPTPPAQ